VKKYKTELEEDRIVSKHLDTLYNSMLEQNLCRYPLEYRILSQSCLQGIFGRPYGFASFYIAFFTCLFIEELPNDPTSASQGMSASARSPYLHLELHLFLLLG
jgi:hypothetical protein